MNKFEEQKIARCLNHRVMVLDTETTGLSPKQGHRIIEIACLELVDRMPTGRVYHQYIQPERSVDPEAFKIHGIANNFLANKPVFNEIYSEFLAFIEGATLIIHNAPFDCAFIDSEFKRCKKNHPSVETLCHIVDTLVIAREKHPGQRNNLDALCKRYVVDNSKRNYHSALVDVEILAQVYLRMTGGQTSFLDVITEVPIFQDKTARKAATESVDLSQFDLKVIFADADELTAHDAYFESAE